MLHLSKFDCIFKCQVKNSNKDVASSSQFSQKNVSHIHSFSLLLFSFCLHSSSNFYSVTALSNNCFYTVSVCPSVLKFVVADFFSFLSVGCNFVVSIKILPFYSRWQKAKKRRNKFQDKKKFCYKVLKLRLYSIALNAKKLSEYLPLYFDWRN